MVEIEQTTKEIVIKIAIPKKAEDLPESSTGKTNLLTKEQLSPTVKIGGKSYNFRGNILLYTKDLKK